MQKTKPGGGQIRLWLLALCLFSTSEAWAHKVSSVSLISHIDTEKKVYFLDAAMEVVPSVDPAENDQISPEDAARIFAEEYLTVLFDEAEQTPKLEITLEKASDEETPDALQRKQVLVKMTGSIPEQAKEFLVYLDPSCPMAVVMVVIKDDKPSRRMQVILAGEFSRPVNVEPILEGDPFTMEAKKEAEAEETSGTKTAVEENSKDSLRDPEGDFPRTPGEALLSGWSSFFSESLLPALLLVVLFLLTLGRNAIVYEVAALLIGQSLAISLAAWGIVRNMSWTSPLLGLLLAVLSLEVLVHHKFRWWRVAVIGVAGFSAGLVVSGAGSFTSLFLSTSSVSLSMLVGFVTGAELALLVSGLVVAGVLLFLSRFDWYRKSIVQPLAVLLCAYGIYLCVERFL